MVRDPEGTEKRKTSFPERNTVWNLGGFVKKKLLSVNITACLCCHLPVLPLETHLRKVQIPILLHADTFKTNQYCKHYVSIGAN